MSPEYRVILERMRSSAGFVRRAVEAAPPGRVGQPPREGEWSALETLTHLRDVVVHVYGLRIRRLLYEEAPVFADFDEEGYRRASWPAVRRSEISWTQSWPSTSNSHGCSRHCPRPTGRARVGIRRSASCPLSFSPGGSVSTPRSTRLRSPRQRVSAKQDEPGLATNATSEGVHAGGRGSRTAEQNALFRALESWPLTVVARLAVASCLRERVPWLIDNRWPGVRSSVVARTRLIDDAIAA